MEAVYWSNKTLLSSVNRKNKQSQLHCKFDVSYDVTRYRNRLIAKQVPRLTCLCSILIQTSWSYYGCSSLSRNVIVKTNNRVALLTTAIVWTLLYGHACITVTNLLGTPLQATKDIYIQGVSRL
jgi:hypothetical protein